MTETVLTAKSSLSEAVEDTSNYFSQQKSFTFQVESFKNQMLRDLTESGKDAQNYLGKLVKGLEDVLRTMLSGISSSALKAETSLKNLGQASHSPFFRSRDGLHGLESCQIE